MIELVQLEEQHDAFKARNTRIMAVSLDELEDSARTQKKFPHLTIVSDADRKLSEAVKVIGPLRGPDGKETLAPTTILIDNKGTVRWVFRPDAFISRLSPAELLARVDEYLQ